MVDSFLLALFVVLTLLNLIDSALTRIGVKEGYEEKMPFTKELIIKFGLNKGMVIKSLLVPTILAIMVLLSQINMGVIWGTDCLFIVALVLFSYVIINDCAVLWKGRH